MPIHPLAQASLAFFGNQPRLVVLTDEVVQIVVSHQNHIAAPPAIASARTTLWPILLALERDTALSAMSGPGIDFDLIDKHGKNKKGEARASPRNYICPA
jgi:hypothetical protein